MRGDPINGLYLYTLQIAWMFAISLFLTVLSLFTESEYKKYQTDLNTQARLKYKKHPMDQKSKYDGR